MVPRGGFFNFSRSIAVVLRGYSIYTRCFLLSYMMGIWWRERCSTAIVYSVEVGYGYWHRANRPI